MKMQFHKAVVKVLVIVQNEESFIVVDGAYSGQNLRDAALEKNVQLISTSLKGIRSRTSMQILK